MTYEKFVETWKNEILPNKHPHVRDGQSLMNYLGDVWFEEYKRVSSQHFYSETDIDCFYRDSIITNTMNHLSKVWNNYPN